MKFILLSQARQGSTLLQTMLNSHSKIKFEGELLQDKKRIERLGKPLGYLIKRHFSIPYLNIQAYQSNKPHWGFKLILNQANDPVKLVSKLYNHGYKIIDLRRKNGLEVAISACIATKSGKWYIKDKQDQHKIPIYIEPEMLFLRLAHYESQILLQNEIINQLDHFQVSYEDNLITAEKRFKFSQDFCGHYNIPWEEMQDVTLPSDERKHHERVINYNQLINSVKNSPFDYLLE